MTYDEIITKLSTTDIDPDQFDTVLETLEAMGVEVIRDANSAEGPQTPEAAPEIDDMIFPCPRGHLQALTTLCACTLKEIGKVPLLSADEEINIAMRMEKGDEAKQMLESGMRTPMAIALDRRGKEAVPGRSSMTARRRSACWPRPTCAWSCPLPSAMWAAACCSWI